MPEVKDMRALVEELEEKRKIVYEMGGPKRIKRQHDRGKLTCRERIDILLDEGTFFEMGAHGSEWEDELLPAPIDVGNGCSRIASNRVGSPDAVSPR